MTIFATENNKKLNPQNITIMKTMKAMILVVMMTIATSASAMSYSEARNEALFLADKMAYELNLTDEQYEAAYEINLDYLLNVDRYDDAYGAYWRIRNSSLAAILADWQYAAYEAASYFYRPLAWIDNVLSLRIYSRYTNPRKFYRSRPAVYVTYRGGHSQNYYASRSWNKPARRNIKKQPVQVQRIQSTRQNRNWNTQASRNGMSNKARTWSVPTKNIPNGNNSRSWKNSERTFQGNMNQARVENRNKTSNISFGNGKRTNADNRMLAQNNNHNRTNRTFGR
jgi:hypothetical protein